MRHNRTGNGSADRRQRQTGRPENLRNCTVCEEVIAETDQREKEEEEREDLGVPQPYNRLIERAEEGRSGEEVPRPRRQLPQGMIAASAEHHRAESTSDHTRQRREPIRPQPVRRSAAQPGAAAAAAAVRPQNPAVPRHRQRSAEAEAKLERAMRRIDQLTEQLAAEVAAAAVEEMQSDDVEEEAPGLEAEAAVPPAPAADPHDADLHEAPDAPAPPAAPRVAVDTIAAIVAAVQAAQQPRAPQISRPPRNLAYPPTNPSKPIPARHPKRWKGRASNCIRGANKPRRGPVYST